MELIDANLTHYDRKLQKLFSERTGASQERILELMKRGDNLSWPIFAEEALELKFVDSILPADYKLFFPPAFPKPATPAEEKKEL
jgi:ATP-dependent protease ClpP protease subunit